DLRGAHERDLRDEPVAAAALGACWRGLDHRQHLRARHAGTAKPLLSVGSLPGRVQLGSGVKVMAIDYQRLKNRQFPEIVHSYSARDTMLYALGVGVGHDPLDEAALDFVYEARLKALPTL